MVTGKVLVSRYYSATAAGNASIKRRRDVEMEMKEIFRKLISVKASRKNGTFRHPSTFQDCF